MPDKLAVHGGPKTIDREFPPYRSYGDEEVAAAAAVVRDGSLSAYLGSWGEQFLGGPRVQAFEREWERAFEVGHAVAVNSATSGLIAAVGALGVEPGSEVIVTPWTMSATATAILVWNAVPVFADIEPATFGLDPEAVERLVTPRTEAIVVTDIFGHAAELDEIMAVARRHGLKVVEDAAQAPGARYRDRYVGTIADVGVFSLNYHKHIHTGEGGLCVTGDPELAERMQLIRNHAEAVADGKRERNLVNLVGFNFRLGEVEAAMGSEQLRKLEGLAEGRTRVGARLTEGLRQLPGLRTPVVREGCSHVYYMYGLVLEPPALEVGREAIVEALRAEGVPALMSGYVNVHLLPLFQRRIAYGAGGFPWTSDVYEGEVSYERGVCPTAEELHAESFIGMLVCLHRFDDDDVDLVIEAFHKVWSGLDALR